jgi:hypothetical protein
MLVSGRVTSTEGRRPGTTIGRGGRPPIPSGSDPWVTCIGVEAVVGHDDGAAPGDGPTHRRIGSVRLCRASGDSARTRAEDGDSVVFASGHRGLELIDPASRPLPTVRPGEWSDAGWSVPRSAWHGAAIGRPSDCHEPRWSCDLLIRGRLAARERSSISACALKVRISADSRCSVPPDTPNDCAPEGCGAVQSYECAAVNCTSGVRRSGPHGTTVGGSGDDH